MLAFQALHEWFTHLTLRGRQTGLVGLPGIGKTALYLPEMRNTASSQQNVAWVRRLNTKASTYPVAAFSTH